MTRAPRAWRPLTVVIGLGLILGATAVAATTVGPIPVKFWDALLIVVGKALGSAPDNLLLEQDVIWNVRLPRVLVAGLAGASLAVSGAAMQGLFNNPLAEPGLAGVSAGGAFGAVVALFLEWQFVHLWLVPAAAFAGALAAAVIVYWLATEGGRTDMATLLLAGLAISALCGALISLIYHFVEDGLLRQIAYWLMGNLSARRWEHVVTLAPFAALGSLGLWLFSAELNLLLGGEEEAHSLGVSVQQTRRWILALVALTTGAATSVAGNIGFVGLMVPHMVRLLTGPDYRWLLPASALAGAVLLIGADLVARVAFSPVELRTGIVTALLGVPFFLYLLVKRRHMVRWN